MSFKIIFRRFTLIIIKTTPTSSLVTLHYEQFQTNSKAEIANELDNLRKKHEKSKEDEVKMATELAGLR